MGRNSKHTSLRQMIRDYIESIVVAIFLALILRMFVISAYKIPTASMLPTLKVGDFIFAYKLPYGLKIPFGNQKIFVSTQPKRGDVVVFQYPGDLTVSYVKRLVAVPGDKIAIKNKKLYVNDVVAEYEDQPMDSSMAGQDFYKIRKEKILGSTRLVMFRKADETSFFGPQVVPPDHFFVLGDNRDSSDDSRYWGMVPISNLEGRVVCIWLSLDWDQRWMGIPTPRFDRVFSTVN